MNNLLIACSQVQKNYQEGGIKIPVLKNIDLEIREGDKIAIIGPSGSGKSTLLHLLGGLDFPSQGELTIQGIAWESLSEKKRCSLRNQELGFVYQFHHLLPEFSALENVAMPLLLAGKTTEEAKKQAEEMLVAVGLSHRLHHRPLKLSGGERQRVAIARAMVHRPPCVLADEPTGNLDQLTAFKIYELMLGLNKQFNMALVIVTHDQVLAGKMDRVFKLSDGQLNPVERQKTAWQDT